MRKVIWLALSILALVCLFPIEVAALGVAMGPTNLEIPDALRGIEYERTVTVFNPSDPETTYSLTAEGQAASWVKFCDLNTQQVIRSLTIPGKSNTAVILKINIPSDIKNGSYSASIYAETAPAGNAGDMGVSSILQAKSVLNVTVSGTQIIQGSVLSIEASDTEAGFPLRMMVNFKNTGNIAVKPQIECLIAKGDQTVTRFSYDKTEVRPENQEAIPVEWATTIEQTGEYTSKVSVLLNGELVTTKDLSFKVLPPGTFTKQGELTSLKYEGQPGLDSMLKILAGFKNTGEGAARAKLIAEVYNDGNLVDTFQSEETIVPIGQTGNLLAYFKAAKAGNYIIRGYVSYEGKQTEVKEIAIEVGATGSKSAPEPAKSSNPTNLANQSMMIYYIIGGVVLVLLIVGGVFVFKKKSTKSGR